MKEGIYENLTFAEYQAIRAVNSSGLKIFARSPEHYKRWLDGEVRDRDTESMQLGRAVHCLVLTPDVFNLDFAKGPDVRRNANEWKDFAGANAGKSLLKPKEYDTAFLMAQRIKTDEVAAPYLRNGLTEVTLVWKDKSTKLLCKARLDLYSQSKSAIVDLKTTSNASPESFGRAIEDYKYRLQAAHYANGASALGLQVKEFVFIAAETEEHYPVATYRLSTDALYFSQLELKNILTRYESCLETDSWPGYTPRVKEIAPPRYVMSKLEEEYGQPV